MTSALDRYRAARRLGLDEQPEKAEDRLRDPLARHVVSDVVSPNKSDREQRASRSSPAQGLSPEGDPWDGTALGDIRYTLQTDRGDLLYVQSRSVHHGSAETYLVE